MRTLVLLLLSLVACRSATAPAPRSQPPVWVKKSLSAGAQCRAPATAPSLAEVETSLAAIGVAIREREMKERPVCEACGCPSYAVDYRFLIPAEAVARAEEIGFAGVVEGDDDCAQWMRTCSCAFECTPRWAVNPAPVASCKDKVDCSQIQPAQARCVARAGACTYVPVASP